MTIRRLRIGAGLAASAAAVSLLVLGPAVVAGGTEMVPHRAFYTLSLHSARPGTTVSSARGAMFLEWEEDCDGWASSQRFQLRLFNVTEPMVDIDSRFASWESKDGLTYHFTLKNLRNGQPEKELRGQATLEGKGKGGTAEFLGLEPARVELPPGTVFPFRHLVEVIDAARAGEKVISRLVFDGTDEEGVVEVNGVIGAAHPPEEGESKLPASAERPSWDMRFAFFRAKSDEVLPFYELTVRLLDNGIARQFLLDYGDTVIRVDLDRIEILPRPSC